MSLRNSSSAAVHGRILLVDDNANGLCARKSVLEDLGHKIATACNGMEALEVYAQHKFDLVVTDYKMPKMDGLELIVHLRKLTPELPIILVSGFVEALGLNEASTGADVVIQKSANEVSHLTRAVARMLRKPARKSAGAEAGRAKAKGKAV